MQNATAPVLGDARSGMGKGAESGKEVLTANRKESKESAATGTSAGFEVIPEDEVL